MEVDNGNEQSSWRAPDVESHDGGLVRSWKLRSFDDPPNNRSMNPYLEDPDRNSVLPLDREVASLWNAQVADTKSITQCPLDCLSSWSWVVRILAHNLEYAVKNDKGLFPSKDGDQIMSTWSTSTAWFAEAAHGKGDNAQYLITAAHNVVVAVPPHDRSGRVVNPKGGPLSTNIGRARADAVYVIATDGYHIYRGWAESVAVMSDYLNDPNQGKPCSRRDMAALRIANSTFPPKLLEAAPHIARLPAKLPKVSINFITAGYASKGAQAFASTCGLYLGRRKRNEGGTGYSVLDFPATQVWRQQIGDGDPLQDQGTLHWDILETDSQNNDKGVVSVKGMSGGPGVAAILMPRSGNYDICIISVNFGERTGSVFEDISGDKTTDPIAADPIRLLRAVGATASMTWELCGLTEDDREFQEFLGAFWGAHVVRGPEK